YLLLTLAFDQLYWLHLKSCLFTYTSLFRSLLWAVPKASLISTSPSDAQYSPSLGSFLLSRLPKSLSISWKRVFSISRMSPSFSSLIASSSSLPSLVGTNLTDSPLISCNFSATDFNDKAFLSSLLLILP